MSQTFHYENLIEGTISQQQCGFFLNSELANKKNDKGSKVSFLKIGSLEINHPGDIANALNDFLVDIAENIK